MAADPRKEAALMDPRNDLEATGTLPVAAQGARPEQPAWVEDARAGLTVPGRYLAWQDGDRRVVVPVSREWTRIGRSLAADLRFDDATVSRRHALIACEEDGVRVLDDRSLNGIEVNGRRVDWSPLTDGDAISVGRHVLYFLDTAAVPAASAAPSGAAVTE
jgi:pSer/pThr/pTyr-binding forkhead associated (FHA) protein